MTNNQINFINEKKEQIFSIPDGIDTILINKFVSGISGAVFAVVF